MEELEGQQLQDYEHHHTQPMILKLMLTWFRKMFQLNHHPSSFNYLRSSFPMEELEGQQQLGYEYHHKSIEPLIIDQISYIIVELNIHFFFSFIQQFQIVLRFLKLIPIYQFLSLLFVVQQEQVFLNQHLLCIIQIFSQLKFLLRELR